jgi:hypothetical protein
MNQAMDKQEIRELMMAVLDDESSPEDRRKLDRALADDAVLRFEWEELRKVKEVTNMMSIRKPPDHVWQDYWTSVYARLERGIAWVFISLGVIVTLSWGVWEAVQEISADADVPTLVKIAIAALFVGILILAVSVVREKLFVRRSDPYKDIER